MIDETQKNIIITACIFIIIMLAVSFFSYVIYTSEHIEKIKTIEDTLIGYTRMDGFLVTKYNIKFKNTTVLVENADIDYIGLFIGKKVIFTYEYNHISSMMQTGVEHNTYIDITYSI